MDWPIVSGEVANEAFDDSIGQPILFVEFQDVEDVAGMLPIHGRH
jgi:hypothetical protein